MEIQVDIRKGEGRGIQCRRFFAPDVVPVQLKISAQYSIVLISSTDMSQFSISTRASPFSANFNM